MANMTKSELIPCVAEAAGITRGAAEKAINALFHHMAVELENGHEVRLAGFGCFFPKVRRPRRIRLNGEEITTREYSTVAFRPYETLKQYVD